MLWGDDSIKESNNGWQKYTGSAYVSIANSQKKVERHVKWEKGRCELAKAIIVAMTPSVANPAYRVKILFDSLWDER